MVDWDNTATVAVPAYDILRVLILQRRDAFIEAYEAYNRAKGKSMLSQTYEIRSRLRSLYEEIYAPFVKNLKEDERQDFEKLLESKNMDELLRAWRKLNVWLYEKKLTQFDTKTQYDPTRTEKENTRKDV